MIAIAIAIAIEIGSDFQTSVYCLELRHRLLSRMILYTDYKRLYCLKKLFNSKNGSSNRTFIIEAFTICISSFYKF